MKVMEVLSDMFQNMAQKYNSLVVGACGWQNDGKAEAPGVGVSIR